MEVAGPPSGIPLAVIVEFFPPHLGSDRRIFELVSRLNGRFRPYFVRLFPFRGFFEPALAAPMLSKDGVSNESGIPHEFLSLPRPLASLAGLFLFPILLPIFLLRLVNTLRRMAARAVLVNYPSPYTGLLGFLAGRIRGLKVVVDFSDLMSDYIPATFAFADHIPIRSLIRKIETFIVTSCDGLVVTTELLETYAKGQTLSVPVVRIPNGVDIDTFGSGAVQEERPAVAAYAGRLTTWTGLGLLWDIARLCQERGLDVVVHVAGSGEAEDVLKGVQYVGVLERTAVPEFLSSARYALVPFLDLPSTNAASPLMLFETLAAGNVVLASDLEGIREVVLNGENGFLLDPDRPEEWVAVLEDLEEDTRLRERVRRGALETAVNYEWRTLARRLLDFLKEVIQEDGDSR